MEPQDAFRFLGLDCTATPRDVDEKYRELAKELHPDQGGTDESMAQLGAARSVAIDSLNYWGLVPLEAAQSALAAIRSGQEQQRLLAERVTKAEETLRSRSTIPLRRRRKAGGIVAAVSAAALFLGNQLPPEMLNRPLLPTLDAATELAWMEDAFTTLERPDAIGTLAARELLLLRIEHELGRLEDARPGSIPVAYNDLDDLDAVSEALDGEAFFEFIDRLRQSPNNSVRIAYFARNLWALSAVWEQFSTAPDGAREYLRVLRPRLRLGTQEANEVIGAQNRQISERNRDLRWLWIAVWLVIAVGAGVASRQRSHDIERIEQELRALEEQTSTAPLLYGILRDVLPDDMRGRWTLDGLAAALDKCAQNGDGPYAIALRGLGARAFAQLLMDRAQQIGLISVYSKFNDHNIVEHYEMRTRGDAPGWCVGKLS